MILTIVVRQSEERLIHFLNDIREGRCDDESSRFAAELCREPLDPANFGVEHVVQLFPTNDEVDVANGWVAVSQALSFLHGLRKGFWDRQGANIVAVRSICQANVAWPWK